MKRPGSYHSCLIPYKKEIFNLWFAERKPARFIQELLKQKYEIAVAISTITRFIAVRKEKIDPHDSMPQPSAPQKKPTEVIPKRALDEQKKARLELASVATKIGGLSDRELWEATVRARKKR